MVARRIKFLSEVLNDPAIIAALAADSAGTPEVDGRLAEMMDEKSDDYAHLRRQLTQLKLPYDFHQRRVNDGDNAIWHYGRDGVEHFSNYGLVEDGQPEIMPLHSQQD